MVFLVFSFLFFLWLLFAVYFPKFATYLSIALFVGFLAGFQELDLQNDGGAGVGYFLGMVTSFVMCGISASFWIYHGKDNGAENRQIVGLYGVWVLMLAVYTGLTVGQKKD